MPSARTEDSSVMTQRGGQAVHHPSALRLSKHVCFRKSCGCSQAFRRAEDLRDSAARQAVAAAARVQATAGSGKAHVWAAAVPRQPAVPCDVWD